MSGEAGNVILPGQKVDGLLPNQTVTVIAVDQLDDDLIEFHFRDETGRSSARLLNAAEVAALRTINDGGGDTPFSGDPNEFKLAAEALRIKYAALYDPMAAVNSSDVQPLPHQISAVYEELLPKIPLRFLLADDPGAGKTIMAGLYLKELILRSDCERALIVAPGGLVEQWRDELQDKFNLNFEIFHRSMVDAAGARNVFSEHPYLIARMDQLSRSDDLLDQLADSRWDVVVVDEAHRMSAKYWGGEVDETKRFKLGRLLSERTDNLLLMTATPHAGKEQDFQLFLTLLDQDRFEGEFREDVHRTDTQGIMRRMVKEDLLTFEGKPLFPERHAYTTEYELSPAEQELYEQVTEYVRDEMGRADRISEAGDKKRGRNVGFALTMLQRRLASSPEAILRSLERRRERLRGRLLDMERGIFRNDDDGGPRRLPSDLDDYDDVDGDLTEEQREVLADEVIDAATAAQTIPELKTEIGMLDSLIVTARRVRNLDDDAKWVQLRTILDEEVLTQNSASPSGGGGSRQADQILASPSGGGGSRQADGGGSGSSRKIIIFTEHRDTLDYLQRKIAAQFGRPDAVITIHGGTNREQRKVAREKFTNNPDTVVLLATDAAGEGLNLQRAHLMVNYDLPWNPNRIEQRFGRIHRIGQHEVCHLWNLVAKDTREGEVFGRLLSKIEQMSKAYNGALFNVLGEGSAFQDRSLRELLLEAIQYGDRPEVKARLDEVIDASVSEGQAELLAERALHPEMFDALNLDEVRRRMELARERKLQPGFIRGFFLPAFERLGGRIRKRESRRRYEITRVPPRLVDIARRLNRLAPVADKYERITFETSMIRAPVVEHVETTGSTGTAMIDADLIAPGHPLLDAVIEATIEDLGHALKQGTVLVDRRDEQADEIAIAYLVEQKIESMFASPSGGGGRRPEGATASRNRPTVISHHFDYPILSRDGSVTVAQTPPYQLYDPPETDEAPAIAEILTDPWVRADHEREIKVPLYREGLAPRLSETTARVVAEVNRTRAQVRERLLAEINHWDREYNRLEEAERSGKTGKIRAETARNRALQREERLNRRMAELDQAVQLIAVPSTIRGAALVIPSAFLASPSGGGSQPVEPAGGSRQAAGRGIADNPEPEAAEIFATGTFGTDQEAKRRVERAAVDAVLAAERALGRTPEEMPRNNPGFDIRSTDSNGNMYYIEVKGRVSGADLFTITTGEVSFAQTQGDRHRLALVSVDFASGEPTTHLRYVTNAFDHIEPSVTTRSFNEPWKPYWQRGRQPH
ncbi:MAG: SNF2-related protein [Promicromonosporaceae bacterium]|nr:SNF2-related protein [Promicromonosporaceae bacterium]